LIDSTATLLIGKDRSVLSFSGGSDGCIRSALNFIHLSFSLRSGAVQRVRDLLMAMSNPHPLTPCPGYSSSSLRSSC
jgi:hypothetical protein